MNYAQYIASLLPKYIKKIIVTPLDLTLIVKSPEDIEQVVQFLKDHTNCQFKTLIDITAVDYPNREDRFEVVYQLLSVKYNSRIRVKANVNEMSAVPSITPIFSCASWLEREVWDMFGVYFKNHPDLRRILTDYGFQGYPLRKDFPLSGYVEVRYDDEEKRVVSEPIEMTQEFRQFDYKNPWS